jgi:hypothetical protein
MLCAGCAASHSAAPVDKQAGDVFEFDQPDLDGSLEPLEMGSTRKDREAFIESVRQGLRNSTVPNTADSNGNDESDHSASWWETHKPDMDDVRIDWSTVLIQILCP